MTEEKRKAFAGTIIDGLVCVPQWVASKICGVTTTNLRNTGVESFRKEGSTSWYLVTDCLDYLAGRSARAAPKARDRLSELKADELELDLAERRGAIAQIDALQAAEDAKCVEVRAQSRGWGHSVAHEIGAADPLATGDIIQSRLEQLLTALAESTFEVAALPQGQAARVDGNGVGRQQP